VIGDIAPVINLSSQKEWSASFPMGPRADPKHTGKQITLFPILGNESHSTINHPVVESLQ